MKWDKKLIELVEDCLWDLVDTTKMSGNTVQDAIEALHEKEAQIKVNGNDTSHGKALHKHFVTNNEVAVCPKCKGDANSYLSGFRIYCDRCGGTGQIDC